ncbi:hypothetical protein LX64_02945 [Chitinophaga skermanii]|uniref:Uncharacterized protein n=1 Tax=Chitinophaga skermanii TaxID=331697 RepID=A0A327QJA9_9BACT|nr:hypothetical protein [Chitinophaga skermanii]RAJ04068.1 hypothetical protein LX64_02945 [Chitinophaga skermanii]
MAGYIYIWPFLVPQKTEWLVFSGWPFLFIYLIHSMQYEVYKDLYIRDNYTIFEFFSIGYKVIPKRIAFIPTEYAEVYNLVLGDIDVDGEINDFSVSDNGDRNKVLATVAYAAE